ncbi:DUF2935 domain-containing protein [Heliobacterium chlorum]|uniref:DUF2935 domain-containing protein n=1 Tax=Heliobacterium chlorum TaxID=2698 RepID=UPI001A9A9C8B|nr:DUF2935 domain-containing protein [Heliobacterium chlorum]
MRYVRVPDLILPPVSNPDMKEIQFWLRIMMEHALFMQLGFPCTEAEFIRQAIQFQRAFEELLKESECVQPAQFRDFVGRTIRLTEKIREFKRRVLHTVITCGLKLGGYNFPLLLDHISREAEYFLLVLHKVETGDTSIAYHSIIQENVFWLRIMGEHAKFIRSLLDQSERKIAQQAQAFSDEFDMLLAQARDLEGFLWDFPQVPTLPRFEEDIKSSTIRLRNFKKEAKELLERCAMLSLIPVALADHVRREAEHFLMIIDKIQRELSTERKKS